MTQLDACLKEIMKELGAGTPQEALASVVRMDAELTSLREVVERVRNDCNAAIESAEQIPDSLGAMGVAAQACDTLTLLPGKTHGEGDMERCTVCGAPIETHDDDHDCRAHVGPGTGCCEVCGATPVDGVFPRILRSGAPC